MMKLKLKNMNLLIVKKISIDRVAVAVKYIAKKQNDGPSNNNKALLVLQYFFIDILTLLDNKI